MFTVSKTSLENVLRDIRNGEILPDRWEEEEIQQEEEQTEYKRSWEEEEVKPKKVK